MSLNKLHPRLQDFVKDKWKGLTEIQEKAFDPIFKGTSCTIEAPTSGGKTEAVLFPLLTRIAANKTAGFKVLYIAPLKALLDDLAIRVLPYAKMCYMEAFKWHGDVSQSDKVQRMIFPSDILLTTPESIEAILLRRGNWKHVFCNLEAIVIDDAHYFAMTERGAHLLSLLERIEEGLVSSPQRIAVTTTIGNREGLLQWLLGKRDGGVCIYEDTSKANIRDFRVHFFMDDDAGLYDNLYKLLWNKKSIVFDRSRTGTEDTATKINERNNRNQSRLPIQVKTHHSSVDKALRKQAESDMKSSSLNAIINTSTLESSINIDNFEQVIQIGGLGSVSSFLQRVGRTGRKKGSAQVFRGLCTDQEELLLLTGCVSLGMRQSSEAILLPYRSFHILVHQTICYCIQNFGATADQIWNTISKASCYSKITRGEFDMLIEHMVGEDFLRTANDNVLLVSKKTEDLYLRANYKRLFAIFDTLQMYDVLNGQRKIGTLDAEFSRSQSIPFTFVLGGMEWDTIKIDHEAQQITVKKNDTGVAPKWDTRNNFDVPFELAQEIGRLLMNSEAIEFLDTSAHKIMDAMRVEYGELVWAKDKWIMEGASNAEKIYIWTFAGDKINRTIRTLLKNKLQTEVSYDYKKVIIENKKSRSLNEINELIISLGKHTETELLTMLESIVKPQWFSKFSDCLPAELSKRTLIEKGMDLSGLIRQLNIVVLDY